MKQTSLTSETPFKPGDKFTLPGYDHFYRDKLMVVTSVIPESELPGGLVNAIDENETASNRWVTKPSYGFQEKHLEYLRETGKLRMHTGSQTEAKL